MTTVRHVARAIGSTGSATPAYQVAIRVEGHQLTADEPPAVGGGNVGPTPFGLLLSALAACTATTLRMSATRKGWELASIEIDLRYDVHDDGRAVIERTIVVPADATAEQREHLAAVAERTPVTLAIRNGTPINTALTSRNT